MSDSRLDWRSSLLHLKCNGPVADRETVAVAKNELHFRVFEPDNAFRAVSN